MVIVMSNYRNHAIGGLIFALPFAPGIFYLFFALLGASIPDMDHDNNINKVGTMLIWGVILSVFLFFVDGLNISALLLVGLAIIFYISKHRGFTHTILGITILSYVFLLMIMGFIPVFMRLSLNLGISIPTVVYIFVIMAIIGYFIISRRYYILYLAVLLVYLYLFPIDYLSINWLSVFLMFFLGALSHIILDLFTPSGVSFLQPFNDSKFHSNIAWILIILWLLASVYTLCNYGSFINNFTPIFT
ncbi:MAG: hypothetical protein E7Z86_03235 [Methanosphaera stadtmanae]|nr:hypothetical protein [Methanosphaera stadtmanae]